MNNLGLWFLGAGAALAASAVSLLGWGGRGGPYRMYQRLSGEYDEQQISFLELLKFLLNIDTLNFPTYHFKISVNFM